MTDKELIARLRSNIFGTGTTMLASDRIEDLTEQLAAAIIAGAGIWAALIWWAPAAAGVLAVVCGALVLWGL